MQKISEKLRRIADFYDNLGDDLSRDIFAARMEVIKRGSYSNPFISLKPKELEWRCQEVDELLSKFPMGINKKIIIFGAGTDGRDIKEVLSTQPYCLTTSFFCDNDRNRIHTKFCGIEIISPEELAESHKDAVIAIANHKHNKQILKQLICTGFEESNILFKDGYMAADYGEQYFDLDALPVGENEVFIDGGAYDCQSSVGFVKWCGGKYKHIYAFEPELPNLQLCERIIKEEKIENITLVQKGLWKESGTVYFNGGSGTSSRITDNEEGDSIEVISIDDITNGECVNEPETEKITYIKLDVEGVEMEALKGAEKTILRDKPKLAICVYHNLMDILVITDYLTQLMPEYKFYLRHYRQNMWETVLYAFIPTGNL